MASSQPSAVLRFIRTIVPARASCTLPDHELVRRFLSHQDETAFAVLVERHGPLVLGVCRRLLRGTEDAEDAFQATFLVLVRKAGSITKRESVGSWLNGVACRVALKARSQAARRRAVERELRDLRAAAPHGRVGSDFGPALDEELSRLPDRYRIPLVLCYLEGKSTEEAARQIGCPRGTVLSRMARGREQLRRRLVQRGLAAPAVLTLAIPWEESAPTAVPPALAQSTIQAARAFIAGEAIGRSISAHAAALAKGAMHTMLLTKLWNGAAVLLTASVLIAVTGRLVQQARAGTGGEEPRPELMPGNTDAIRLPAEAVAKLGVCIGEAKPRGPARPRLLILPGSLAIDPGRVSRIRTRVSPAEVVEIADVVPGSSVKKGALLVVLRSLDVAQKKGDLIDALVRLRLDQDILARVEKAARDGAVPEATLLSARRNVESSRNSMSRVETTLRILQVPEADIKAVKAYAEALGKAKGKRDPEKEKDWARVELRAPRDGVIVEKNVALGEILSDGTTTLFTLADLSKLQVLVNAPEDELASLQALKPDQRRWSIRPVNGQAVEGQIEEIGYLIDPNQHTALIKGTVPNAEGRLRAGQFITATITLPRPVQELVVPTSALVEDGRDTYLFVQPDPTQPVYVQRRVVVVRRGHDTAHVRYPWKSGERVVTTGALDLKAALDDLKAERK
jgi:cobalt-zinc-cadmium efflux system membrane fusion protein